MVERDLAGVKRRAEELFRGRLQGVARRTDRMFAALMAGQWAFGVALALWVSPRAWEGTSSSVHVHVLAAVGLGGLISSLPIWLALRRPSSRLTRHVIAVGQMLTSALLIHLSGGRIETHFHVFGSLAFLAFYQDWTVLATATAVVALDHGLRGVLWPQSVYGVDVVQSWRFVEHTAWVAFEDVFLYFSISRSLLDARDISLRQAELEEINRGVEQKIIERTEELARSNAELERFAYAASHDLQEPLRKVANFTQLLGRRYRGRLDAEADLYIERASAAAVRMSELINALLQLSRVGNGDASFEHVEATELLADVLGDLELPIRDSGAVVSVSRLPSVRACRGQLAQVFQNLLGNAIKFRGDAPPRVRVWAEREGKDWRFCVEDNGIGIEPEQSGRLFVIFRRLHTRSEYPGNGIGLAMAKKIVERHHGRIWVESEAGRGARFLFTLPAGEEALEHA